MDDNRYDVRSDDALIEGRQQKEELKTLIFLVNVNNDWTCLFIPISSQKTNYFSLFQSRP